LLASEPIGELVMRELPMKLLIVDVEAVEVKSKLLQRLKLCRSLNQLSGEVRYRTATTYEKNRS
jgi:hypothetical protein